MTKNWSLGLFVVLIAALSALAWTRTGSPLPPAGENQIWYHAGLLTLLIGTYIVEYRFTKPNDVFVNCLVVFASVSTLTDPPHEGWWALLRWGSLSLGITAMALAWDPGREAQLESQTARTVLYQIVTRLGKAEVIFSFVFILALVSYFELDKPATKLFAVAWGLFLVAAHLDLPSIGRRVISRARMGSRTVLGITHSFLAPSIVYCKKVGNSKAALHQVVAFCQPTLVYSPRCFGIVIGERSAASESRIVVALLKTSVNEAQLNERSLLIETTLRDEPEIDLVANEEEREKLRHLVGTTAKGTNIARLRFELFGNPDVAAGSLLSVKSGERAVFYQVFDGLIDEEVSIRDSTRAFVEGEAEQVGVWDNQAGGFETHDWVAKERSPVMLVDENSPAPQYALKASECRVGAIPHSTYPVNLDVNDLVLYHSAILGVTGSGKSYLTYYLVENCAAKGIKTVCIDPTGDYQRHLLTAVRLTSSEQLKAFLNSNDHSIAIWETAANRAKNPIEQALDVSRFCLDWCRKNRTDAEILNPRAKVLVVLEEAHLLVPEFNFNPDRSLQDKVSAHSQVVLQARKYGLGFLVVSQRTANVVKSVLNQCNTIISFQAFDETGFEFLKNYMGRFHVSSLPNLKPRHGLLVGKASRSRRPIMVKFNDQVRELREEQAPEMPVPAPAQAAQQQEGIVVA